MADFSDEEREDFAHQYGVHVERTRRCRPRLPARTMRIHGNGQGGCIRISDAEFLTERERALFRLFNGEVMNPNRYGADDNLPVPDDLREALKRAARAAFGCEPDDALWLVPFLSELEAGRSERLALETREADSATELGVLVEKVIAQSRRRVQRLAPSVDLPPWLSARLVAVLLTRFSFAGGGGPNGSLTKESIRVLLADPQQLAKYLRATAGRARAFANELSLLDARRDAPIQQDTQPKPAPPDIIDEAHATPLQRREARAARRTPSSLATIKSRMLVWFENGFVGIRTEPSLHSRGPNAW